MEFLIRKKRSKQKVAHYWNGADSYCRMWSTGGMRQSLYAVHAESSRLPICMMCKSVYDDMNPAPQTNDLPITAGICPCGGKLQTSEWETKDKYKGRSTCKSCGRTEFKEFDREDKTERLI